jgi:hypothetical protein
LASGSKLRNWSLRRGVFIYIYPGVTPCVSELQLLSLSPDAAGGNLGRRGASRGGGALLPIRPQHVCGFIDVPFGKEGSHPLDLHVPLPGVFPLSPSPCDSRETQHPASSILRLQLNIPLLVVIFPLLRGGKTLLWPFWPYSRQEAC